MSLFLFSGMTVFASGEGNIDGGGGGMGSGTATDVWHGQDGVRVTVVTTDGSVASTPFDLSNANVANNVLNFGKVCKLQYSSGASLSPNGSYSYSKPGVALPRIISGTSSRASIVSFIFRSTFLFLPVSGGIFIQPLMRAKPSWAFLATKKEWPS